MNKFCFYCFAFLFFSCGQKESLNPLVEFNSTPIKLYPNKIFDLEEVGILRPHTIIKYADNYVIYNSTEQNIFNLLDFTNNKIVQGVNVGQGPGEILSVNSFQIFNDSLFVYDIMKKIIYNINIQNDSIYISDYKKLLVEERLFNVLLVKDGFLATGVFEDDWFRYYNKNSELIDRLKFPSFIEHETLTNIERSSIYFNALASANPENTKLVTASAEGAYVTFNNLYGDSINKIKEKKFYGAKVTPPRKIGQSSIAFDKDSKMGFRGIAGDNNYVYLLYSGKTFDEYLSNSQMGENLLIYDWEGKPLKHFILDIPIDGIITFDDKNKTLSGIGNNPESVLLEYDLTEYIEYN